MRGERGFTLLEVTIAFVIAALALAALTQGAAAGLKTTRVAAHTQEALSRARSRLAAAAVAPRPGEQSGSDGGGFDFRVLTRPVALGTRPEGAGDRKPVRPILYAIQVEISWTSDGGRRRVALSTRRVGAAADEGP